jgi:FtsP/CotA-like multicopper oxidase with cupredoxin domain
MRLLLPLLALLLAAPGLAQREPEWRIAVEYDVLLRPFAYEPKLIRLPAGQPVRLHFVNQSRSTMAFSAPRFFRGARLRPRDADIARRGGLRLAPGERRAVALVAQPGRYPAHSANLVHRLLGMNGEILVEQAP